jgi:hypothetical protein
MGQSLAKHRIAGASTPESENGVVAGTFFATPRLQSFRRFAPTP